ncbi:MAG: hypothetical protein OIF40_05025 [Mangrovicoccus sp.]|nr:hypothetical protein [Mangrovicoccus sp.]
MSAILIVKFCSLMLWCYAAVLTVAWFRAVGAEDQKTHVGHFVGLMGVFVPLSSLLVFSVFAGAMLGLPSIIPILAVVLPAGLVIGLQLEVSRICLSSERMELIRLGCTLCLTMAVLAWRGGI